MYPYYYLPNWEGVPSQMKVEPVKSPVAFAQWPHGSSYGYTSPMECHGCCNHSYCPVYYNFRPSQPPLPPPPPFYYHGIYPPYYPESYPAYYFPLHYPMEQPRYEYDKNMPTHHCCGCPNHKCSPKVENNVKIEEQASEVEKMEPELSEPLKLEDYPYPVVWIPPSYAKESSKSSGLEAKAWNGLFPLDLNNIKYWKHGEDERRGRNQQDDDRKAKIQFPMFRFPVCEKPKETEKKDLKETTTGPKSAEETPSKFKVIPVRLFESDEDRGDKPEVSRVSTNENQSKKGEDKSKSIDVQKMEGENKSSEVTEREPKDIPVEQIEKNGQKTSSGTDKNKGSSSPPKASKLPPVCLRVDPLPRRKSSNGASRSPSPPGLKEALHKDSNGTSTPNTLDVKDRLRHDFIPQDTSPNKIPEEQPKKNDIRTIEVKKDESKKEELTKQDKVQVSVSVPPIHNEEVQEKPVIEKDHFSQKKPMNEECKREIEGGNEKIEEARKEKKKTLSITEAAVLVQSAYRGYEVRKWEPLKKLKQIARINDQVKDLRDRISGLESSAGLQKDEKQRAVVGETIMGLLLQLDTIQGLHPSVRDIRKSVAKELVCLQERLDSMTTQKHAGIKLGTTETVYTDKSSMESAYDSACGNRSNEGREKSELADDIPKPTHEDISDQMKPCHGLPGDERSLAENPVPTDFNREFKEIVDSRLANKSPLLADGEAQADSDSKSPRETCEGPESIVAIFAENKGKGWDKNPDCDSRIEVLNHVQESMTDALPSMVDEEIDPKDESARLPLLEDKENDPKGDFMESSVEVQHIDSDVETVAKSIEPEANQLSARASGEMNGQPSKGYIDLASSKDGECLQQDKHCALNSAEFFCRPLEMKENQEEKLVEAETLMQPVMDGQNYLEKIAEGRDVSNESAADFVSPHSVNYTAIFKDDKVEAEINGESLEMKENQEKIVEAELLMQPVMEGQDYLEEIAKGLDMSNIPESATDFVSPHSADYTAIPKEDNKVGADGEMTVTKMPKSDELEKIDKKPLPWNEDSICNSEKLIFWPSKKEFQREDVVESPNLEVSLHPHIVQEKSQEIIEGQSVSSSDTLDTITSFYSTGYMVAASDIETTTKQGKEETMDDQERALSGLPKVEMEEQYTPSMSLEDSNDVQKEMEASEELEANGSCCCDLEKSEVADEYIMNREDCGKEKIHLVPTSEDKTHLLHGTELAESNKKLREMLNKLIQAGQEQMTIISSLNGRVRDLERKLTRKKRLRRRRGVAAASSSVDNLNCVVKDKAVDCSL